MSRTVLYVAHKLSAATLPEMATNRRRAGLWCAWLCQNFRVATVADWIVMSTHMLEDEENRALGLDCDLTLIERCDAVALTGLTVSGGMKLESEHARQLGKPIIDLTPLRIEIPWSGDLARVVPLLQTAGIRLAKAAA